MGKRRNNKKAKTSSGNIRKHLRNYNITFNENAIMNLTSQKFPLPLRIIASFGKSFNYDVQQKTRNQKSNMTLITKKLINHCKNMMEVKYVKSRMLRSCGKHTEKTTSQRCNNPKKYICQLLK